jgi:hypothetical protein
MAPRKKTLAGTWRGPKSESYTRITWNPHNRIRHEAEYPDRPRFTAAELADWTRIYKRVDVNIPSPEGTASRPLSAVRSSAGIM